MVDFTPVINSRFPLGQMLITPGALDLLQKSGQTPAEFLARHAQCDWGEMSDGDKELNNDALLDGSRLMSAYRTKNNTKIWIITEASDGNGHRCCTTILLPEEY